MCERGRPGGRVPTESRVGSDVPAAPVSAVSEPCGAVPNLRALRSLVCVWPALMFIAQAFAGHAEDQRKAPPAPRPKRRRKTKAAPVEPVLSEYELGRRAKIKRNNKFLVSVGLLFPR